MQRVDAVPVEEPGQPGGVELGGLPDGRAALLLRHLELEPGPPGDLHLGSQPQPPIRLPGLDPPEVERVSHGEDLRVPPAPADTDAADEEVEEAAEAPEETGVVPAALAADPADRRERLRRRRPDPHHAGVDEPGANPHPAVAGGPRACRREGVGPARRGELLVLVRESTLHRPVQAHRHDCGEEPAGRVVPHDGRVAHALDQLAPDARVDRRRQAEPQARQAGRQHGHRDQPASSGRAAPRTPA